MFTLVLISRYRNWGGFLGANRYTMRIARFQNAEITANKNSISIKLDGKEVFKPVATKSGYSNFFKAIYLKIVSEKTVDYDGDLTGIETATEYTCIPLPCELRYSDFQFSISIRNENEEWSEAQTLSISQVIKSTNIYPEYYDVSDLLVYYEENDYFFN